MTKFKESELSENLKFLKNKGKLKLEFEDGIDGKMELDNVTVEYDYKRGFIKIKGEACDLDINTTLICGYEKDEDGVVIRLEAIGLKMKR